MRLMRGSGFCRPLLVLTGVTLMPLVTLAKPQTGKLYTSKAGGFSVVLPGTASPIQKQQGGVTARGVASPVPQGKGVCMVIYFNWRETGAKAPRTNAEKQSFLNESSKGFIKGAQAKLLRQRAVTLQGRQARELLFEIPALKFTGKAHVILSEGRVYQIARLTPKGQAVPPTTERFMKSFKLL